MPKKKNTTTKEATISSTKVFDVARPGKSAANATSRPVIVGHKPQVKDPMMSSQEDSRSLMDSKNKVTLELSTSVPATPTADPTPLPTTQLPGEPLQDKGGTNDISSAILGDAVQVDAPDAPKAAALPQPTSPQIASGQLDGSTGVIYDEAPIEQPPAMLQDTNIEPLPVFPEEQVPSPKVQVVVSHHKPRPSGLAVLGWTIFVVLLAAVVLDVLLDAGIVTLDSVPHTHFF